MGNRVGVCIGVRSQVSSRKLGIRSLMAGLVLILLSSLSLAQTITTIAGGGPPNGITATTAPIGLPWAVVQDSSGNSYISDNFSNRIFKVDTTGKFSVIAGTGLNNYSGDNGAATAATLSSPEGLAIDSNGVLYIADTGNSVIRVVNTGTADVTFFSGTLPQLTVHAGNIATLAGTGTACTPSVTPPSCGDTGLVTAAQFNQPAGVAVDASGNVYVADTKDSAIREIFSTGGFEGEVRLVAGTYTACSATGAGACGDGSSAATAQLNNPMGIALDSTANLYIADTNSSAIRVINQQGAPITIATISINAGAIQTVAGVIGTPCAPTGLTTSCGDGGPAATASLNLPDGVFVDGTGNIFVADTDDSVIREVSTSGTLTLKAGSYVAGFLGDGNSAVGVQTQLNFPTVLFVDSSSDIFVADQSNNAIREITFSTGNISTVAGVGLNQGEYGDGGAATPSAEILNSQGVYVDSTGNVYIADTDNNVVRKVDTKGNITLIAGTIAACVPSTKCGDGAAATKAQLGGPQGVFVDGSGNVFIADTKDNAIREITAGNITTVAGGLALFPCTPGATPPQCGDGGLPTSAQLGLPAAVFVDSTGNIYIADTNNSVIRVVNKQKSSVTFANVSIASGMIGVVAGDYTACSKEPCGDGSAATKAQLNSPEALFVDSSGDIYISDNGDSVIRKVDGKTGIISTVAGNYTSCSALPCGDGGKATSAQFANAFGLWVDILGDIFVADAGRSSIRVVNGQAASATFAGTTISPGDIDRVVGTGAPGLAGDGGAPGTAVLDRPHGLAGDSSGDLFITDTGNQRVRKVTKLLATATPSFSIPTTGTLSPASVSAGSSATATITVTSTAGFASAVSLTCAVTPSQTNPPTCSFSAASVTPTANGTATSTLTVATTGATSALTPAIKRGSSIFYATWLLFPAMVLGTAGVSGTARKKVISHSLLALALAGCIFLVACGGGSSSTSGGGGGGGTGTPSGQYTVTVTATSGSTSHTETLNLTVQ